MSSTSFRGFVPQGSQGPTKSSGLQDRGAVPLQGGCWGTSAPAAPSPCSSAARPAPPAVHPHGALSERPEPARCPGLHWALGDFRDLPGGLPPTPPSGQPSSASCPSGSPLILSAERPPFFLHFCNLFIFLTALNPVSQFASVHYLPPSQGMSLVLLDPVAPGPGTQQVLSRCWWQAESAEGQGRAWPLQERPSPAGDCGAAAPCR